MSASSRSLPQTTMSRFPALLPFDIVFKIFSYLEQKDVIQFMQTSCHWYSEMPLYTIDLWKEITISPTSWSNSNDCLIRCLGPHTKHVSIIEIDMYSVLNRLKDLNCEISSLEIVEEDVNDLPQCIPSNSKFLSMIGQFSNSLTKLSIFEHLSYLPATTVLRHFPSLTHLTLVFSFLLYDDIPERNDDDDLDSSEVWTHQLVYLHLEALLDFDYGIVPVLRRCPMLRILRFSVLGIDGAYAPDNFDMIHQLCPHLTHLSWNEGREAYTRQDDIVLPTSDWNVVSTDINDDDSLQAFLFNGGLWDIGHATTILTGSQHKLEYLSLWFWVTAMAPTPHTELSRICFPRLKTLQIGNLKMASSDWVSFLAGCENIENLDLHLFKEDLLMNTICEAVTSLKHLRYLKLNRHFERWAPHPHEEDTWTNASLLSSSRLEILDLHGVLLTDALLLDLCDIPYLKELILSQVWNDNISREGLLSFTDKLIAEEKSLATLKLMFFPALDDTVLERLSQSKSLSLLIVNWCPKITEAGLELFVANYSGNGKKREVHVQDCSLIRRKRF